MPASNRRTKPAAEPPAEPKAAVKATRMDLEVLVELMASGIAERAAGERHRNEGVIRMAEAERVLQVLRRLHSRLVAELAAED